MDSAKPRIVIFSGSMPSTTFIDGLANALAEEGYPIIIVGRKERAYSYHSNVETIEVPTTTTGRVWFLLKSMFKVKFKDLALIIKKRKGNKRLFLDLLYYIPLLLTKGDILHIQWASFISKRELIFDFFKDRVILSLRGTHINCTPIIDPEIAEIYMKDFPRVWRYHAVSNAIAKNASLYGADPKSIKTIYSYVNDDLLRVELKPKERSRKLNIISVGRFYWNKGLGYAFDAIGLLKEKGVDLQYNVIATGKVPDQVKFQLNQLKIEEDVNIMNALPHKEVLAAIRAADVLLLSSVDEGIANVVLEAMALGTVVVTTDCGGMKEVVEDGHSGYVVRVRDAHAMADALKKVADMSEDSYHSMVSNAKERIRVHHNKKVFIEEFKDLYKI